MRNNEDLVAQGLARWYRGRLIPIMKGGDGTEEDPESVYAEVPNDLATLDDNALAGLVEDYEATIAEVCANPENFVSADLNTEALLEATRNARATLTALKAETAARIVEPENVELSPEDKAAFDALANETEEPEGDPPADPPEGEPEPEANVEPVVVASVVPTPRRLPRPPATHEPVEHEPVEQSIALTAAGGAPDIPLGHKFGSELELAQAMCKRHDSFGQSAPGTVEKFVIARADWKDQYPEGRRLINADLEANFGIINPVINPVAIKKALAERIAAVDKDFSLVASGGLCAPVTPYYNLQYISVPVRPVMGSLPGFNADRGGLRYARPAALSAVTDAVGLITEEEDHAGGSSATKTCQVIPCPNFQETDVDIIYHCLQFGNLGARAFPELVAQWNNLVLAAHARLAESNLLTMIDAFSTQVSAGNLGLGASATLFSQILAAANGMRNRNRMDPEAVLRLILPDWAIDLIVSDVIRTQFQRFDTDEAKVTALLRSFDIEPTFHIDGANGRNQVFGTQGAGPLLPFPDDVVWYLFPEGSFLYLDTGMLELGIVRDSVLNKNNDFQIFGETFENVAYVGVESLAVVSPVCDSGTVSLPASVTCPIDYTVGS